MTDEVVLALVAAASGGLGLAVIQWLRERSGFGQADGAKRRAEWIAEVATLRQRLDAQDQRIQALQDEIDRWQDRYYNLLNEHAVLQREVMELRRRLNASGAE